MQLKGLLLMRSFGLLVDLVYPPGCVVCGIATGRHNGLCPTCWSKVHDRCHGCRGSEGIAHGRSGGHHGFDLCKGSFRNYMTER